MPGGSRKTQHGCETNMSGDLQKMQHGHEVMKHGRDVLMPVMKIGREEKMPGGLWKT